MIILLGPDNAGKTTLAAELNALSMGYTAPYLPWKAVAETGYKDYIELLRGKKSNPLDVSTYKPGPALLYDGNVIADRFFYCELPYARIFRKQERTAFTLKQWHNMHLSTLSFNPTVVLATRKASIYKDHVPEELFGPILAEYKMWLKFHRLPYLTYDWAHPIPEIGIQGGSYAEMLLQFDRQKTAKAQWWINMAKQGYAGVGNTVDPKVIIMAQDLGGMNYHRIAFEHGPSGFYLTDLIDEAEVPLNSFYLTNWLKSPSNKEINVGCLTDELVALTETGRRPVHVILLGREAEASLPLLLSFIPRENVHTIRHPGWVVNHSSPKEMPIRKEAYSKEWRALWDQILGRTKS